MSRRLVALSVSAALALAACSSGSGSDDAAPTTTAAKGATTTSAPRGTTTTADPDQDLDTTVHDAVDITLDLTSYDVDAEAKLVAGAEKVNFGAEGAVDFDTKRASVEFRSTSGTKAEKLILRSDGTHVWNNPGGKVPIPDGKTWLQGDADVLAASSSFNSDGTLGVLYGLRAATDVRKVSTDRFDGDPVTEYRFSTTYKEALDAAADDAGAFKSALSLTYPRPVDLDVKVWLDGDGVIRKVHITIDPDGATELSGTYSLEIDDPNQPVDTPETPPAADTLTGPEAERLVKQLMTS